ncbi:MAG: LysM peptidoglycan-binding domain-containing protein, partial [Anaerolineaceae bacterium]|nr:LysM peptidoglycan-binding domain-containing protein [Anaerolineaceae bacterium]
ALWAYDGRALAGPLAVTWGLEPYAEVDLGASEGLGKGSSFGGITRGLYFPRHDYPDRAYPDWSLAETPLRFDYKAKAAEGTYGAALSFTLKKTADGYQVVDVHVEALPFEPSTTPTPEGPTEKVPFTYTVKVGDTLQKIAAEAGMPVEEILKFNSIDPSGADLYSGMVLILGYQEAPTSQPVDSIPASPQALSINNPHEAIRQRILEPAWDTLWAEGEIHTPNTDGGVQEMVTWTQAYLAKDGRGRVLTSNPKSGMFGFNIDVAVSQVAISDGQSQVRFDMKTKQEDPSAIPIQWIQHPLEAVNPLTQMLLPAYLSLHSQDVQPLKEEVVAGRRVLVLDWAEDRLWVDEETGLILRQERYAGSDRQPPPLYRVQINKLDLGINLVDTVLHPPYLDELAFEPQPVTEETPAPNQAAAASKSGWIYLETAGAAPFQWQVARLPADCLADTQACPSPEYLPGHPNGGMGLIWAPDYSLAADTNHNKLIVYDPATRQWQRVLDIFLQSQLAWSPDGSQIAGVGTGDNGENNRLVAIDRSGWTERTVQTNLDGNMFIYGWLDEHTLLVGRQVYLAKGSALPSDLLAELYRVDIDSGKSDLLLSGALEAALSPDRQKLVASMLQGSSSVLLIANADGSEQHSLNVEGSSPFWSPDGQWILYRSMEGAISSINMIRPDGSEIRKNASVSPANGPFWSPDGKSFLV